MSLQSQIDKLGLQPIINKMVSDLVPVAVVCFGATTSNIESLNCFHSSSSTNNHLDLLIVQSDKCPYKGHEVIDIVKNLFSKQMSLNVLCHREDSVATELERGHPFFSKVFHQGYTLYCKECSNLGLVKFDADWSKFNTSIEWTRPIELAKNFLELAREAITKSANDIGVFLIHQSIEQMCIASVNVHLKYRITSHSIGKSIGLVGCYIPQVRELFPSNTKLERDLFRYLNKAYSDVRYKAGYTIPACIAIALLERANTLMNLIEVSYQNEFAKQS